MLTAQVDRMLDDPRSRTFTSTFIGQWLGTQDLGGRVAPMLTELQTYYTPPVAADLRAEPILLFERILGENRSLLELLTADYTYMTERLVKFYQLEDKFKDFQGNQPQLVQVAGQPARRRDELGRGDGDDVALPADQPGAARRVGAGDAAGNAGAAAAAECARADAGEVRRNCAETAKTAVGMRQRILAHRVEPRLLGMPQPDGPDRLRAGEFRLDRTLAR